MSVYRPPQANSRVSSDKDCRAFGGILNWKKYRKMIKHFKYTVCITFLIQMHCGASCRPQLLIAAPLSMLLAIEDVVAE